MNILQILSYVFIIAGSSGMIIFVLKFPFSSRIGDLSLAEERFLCLNGFQIWIFSWTLIILGTSLQLFGYIGGFFQNFIALNLKLDVITNGFIVNSRWLKVMPFSVGLLLTLSINQIFSKRVTDRVRNKIVLEPPRGISGEEWNRLTEIVPGGDWLGRMDCVIFFVALWNNLGFLFVAWLAFKVAAKWEAWSNITKVPESLTGTENNIDATRARKLWSSMLLQRFILGTGVNILSALIGSGVTNIIFLNRTV